MRIGETGSILDVDRCSVIAGTHEGTSDMAHDLNVSKAGFLRITFVQEDGARFKTLGTNVVVAARL